MIKVLRDFHFSPIRAIKFLHQMDLVVSADESGLVEVWDPETYGKLTILQPFIDFPADHSKLKYEYITGTDFMALAKAKTFALSIAGSTSGTMIAIYARDRRVRVFDVARGALLLTVDDST